MTTDRPSTPSLHPVASKTDCVHAGEPQSRANHTLTSIEGNTGNAVRRRCGVGALERPVHQFALHPLQHRPRMQLARSRGEQHVVDLGQIPPGRKRLPHRRERERHDPPGLLGKRRGECGNGRVKRKRFRPPDRRPTLSRAVRAVNLDSASCYE